ncbi:hypothetical protein RB195_002160 [Necator americanus]|uniref:SCP domain-containing protein n=1 Tax=Necator americanus TaxID=51031 RepID=A0ABR1DHP2_NECAM
MAIFKEPAIQRMAGGYTEFWGSPRMDSFSSKKSAIQVLWAETLTVGCAVTHCTKGGTMVVCQYYPPGNYIGSSMYKEGKTLSECGLEGRNEVPHSETGLCELL